MASTLLDLFERRVKRVKGVFLGFNLNIDVVVHLDENPSLIESLAKFDPQDSISEINTPEDLASALYISISSGSASEYLISKEVQHFLLSSVSKFEERVGGPVGIVGNVLSRLKIPTIIHAPSLSPRQVRLLEKELLFIDGEEFRKIYSRKEDPDLIHWILEFKRGLRVKFGKKEAIAPRENRLIASYDFLNSKLYIRKEYLKMVKEIGERCPHAIISGHHLLTPKVEYKERLKELSKFVKDLSSSGSKIHVEMAFNPFKEVREEIVQKLLREADSIGINEVELSLLLRDLGISQGSLDKDIVALAEELGAERVHLHTYGLYVECVKEGGKFKPDKEALHISSLFAAAKAKLGDIRSTRDLELAEFVPIWPEKMRIAKELDGKKISGYHLIAIPTRIVENPRATVGIGDLISSSAFLFRG